MSDFCSAGRDQPPRKPRTRSTEKALSWSSPLGGGGRHFSSRDASPTVLRLASSARNVPRDLSYPPTCRRRTPHLGPHRDPLLPRVVFLLRRRGSVAASWPGMTKDLVTSEGIACRNLTLSVLVGSMKPSQSCAPQVVRYSVPFTRRVSCLASRGLDPASAEKWAGGTGRRRPLLTGRGHSSHSPTGGA